MKLSHTIIWVLVAIFVLAAIIILFAVYSPWFVGEGAGLP